LTSRLSLLSNTTAVDFNVINQFKSDYGGEYIKQVDEVNDESVLINYNIDRESSRSFKLKTHKRPVSFVTCSDAVMNNSC
jgi:hypothetical protein